MPAPSIRPVTPDRFEEWLRLGVEAFGTLPPGTPAPDPAAFPRPGSHPWGTFVDDALVARMTGFDHLSWFRGAQVPSCGVAGVTVVAEHRGGGLLADLLAALLADAADRGQVLSTLYPTAAGIYRRLGYELIGSFDTVELPMAALAAVRPAEGISTRRAGAADLPAVRAAYAAWASAQNGPLTRTGPVFGASDEEALADVTGLTLAEDEEGRVVGYAAWHRGHGYDASATIRVEDLVALTPDAARALWRVVGTFGSVSGRAHVRTSGDDLTRLVLPGNAWDVVERHPYMLRVHDVAGALSALPLAGEADLAFAVAGDPLGTMDGGCRLRVAGGVASCERGDVGPGALTLTPQGLALAYAGAQSAANLRLAGHLRGGSPEDDVTLDALLGGRQVHVRDYF